MFLRKCPDLINKVMWYRSDCYSKGGEKEESGGGGSTVWVILSSVMLLSLAAVCVFAARVAWRRNHQHQQYQPVVVGPAMLNLQHQPAGAAGPHAAAAAFEMQDVAL